MSRKCHEWPSGRREIERRPALSRVMRGVAGRQRLVRIPSMNPLVKEVRHNPMLWLLVFVPVVLVAHKAKPEAHTMLFVLSVLAIVPLAALLSHATESVAAKTGDTIGGLLNATLGNLTELVIAVAALRVGEYMLVKASIAGAIVTKHYSCSVCRFCWVVSNTTCRNTTALGRGCRRACFFSLRSRCSYLRPFRAPNPQARRRSPGS